ncbi:hypothetical protein PR048_019617 [Dryococelus australis]|uniref:Chromo domain-containing protein n=1 Tax=Dryococelus australis TaxID=614101 RepID=A0ABQ9H3Z8_9NEOP|nr:hypothetical protein PR048_019617 [Dryococelus australis]
MTQYGINHYAKYSELKSSVVKRYNKSIKQLIYKHFTSRGTYKWVDVLLEIVKFYNSRYHRTIKMRSKEVTGNSLIKSIYNNVKVIDERKPKLKVDKHPRVYYLETYDRKPTNGGFYDHELQKVSSPNKYLIDKIIKRKKDMSLVRWRGFSKAHDSWFKNQDHKRLEGVVGLGQVLRGASCGFPLHRRDTGSLDLTGLRSALRYDRLQALVMRHGPTSLCSDPNNATPWCVGSGLSRSPWRQHVAFSPPTPATVAPVRGHDNNRGIIIVFTITASPWENYHPMRVIEACMEWRRNERAGNARSPRKPAHQRHRPARFPLTKIRPFTIVARGPDVTLGSPTAWNSRHLALDYLTVSSAVRCASRAVRVCELHFQSDDIIRVVECYHEKTGKNYLPVWLFLRSGKMPFRQFHPNALPISAPRAIIGKIHMTRELGLNFRILKLV